MYFPQIERETVIDPCFNPAFPDLSSNSSQPFKQKGVHHSQYCFSHGHEVFTFIVFPPAIQGKALGEFLKGAR